MFGKYVNLFKIYNVLANAYPVNSISWDNRRRSRRNSAGRCSYAAVVRRSRRNRQTKTWSCGIQPPREAIRPYRVLARRAEFSRAVPGYRRTARHVTVKETYFVFHKERTFVRITNRDPEKLVSRLRQQVKMMIDHLRSLPFRDTVNPV